MERYIRRRKDSFGRRKHTFGRWKDTFGRRKDAFGGEKIPSDDEKIASDEDKMLSAEKRLCYRIFQTIRGRKNQNYKEIKQMNIHVRRRRDTFIRMKANRQETPGDFPAGSVQAEQMDVVEEVLDEIEQAASKQVGNFGEARFEYNSKGIARENLREEIVDVRDMAGAMAYEFPGIDELFRVRKHITDAEMLALGRAFHEKAADRKADFIRYGLDGTFLADLQTAIDAFEASLTAPEMAVGSQVEATAQLGETVRRGMVARRILMGVMKIKHKNNPAKGQAWLSASHIERDAPKDDEEPPAST